MKHTRTNQSDIKIKLDITLDAGDLAAVKPGTLGRLAKKVKVPGFRPGKVPAGVVEKHIDQDALHSELINDAISKFLIEALSSEQLQPLDRPSVEVSAYVPEQSMEFSAEIEILPEIKLGNYKKLKVKKPATEVSSEEVNAVIERMRTGMAKRQTVERAAQEGDEVLIDFSGTKDGEPVAGASGHDYPLKLGSKTFIPGFEEGIIGKKSGDTFDLPLTFPKDYHAPSLAGQKITFAVTVKTVNELVLPALDDDFAASCGPFKTIAELTEDTANRLRKQKEHETLDAFKNELLEKLADTSDITAPEVMVGDRIASLEHDFAQNLRYRGTTLEDYLQESNLTKEEWQTKELRKSAVRSVQISLALAELRKLENIELDAKELDESWTAMLSMYGNNAKLRGQIDTPEARRDFAHRLITEKVIDRLVELNS